MINLPAGYELNATVCKALDIPGRTLWTLSTDGGKSSYYTADYREDCVRWLADIQKRYPDSWQAKGEVLPLTIYPRVSEEWGAFGGVLTAMEAKGYEISIDTYKEDTWPARVHVAFFVNRKVEPSAADGETILHAGCLAALEAVGYQAP